jgi:hypothetical protein
MSTLPVIGAVLTTTTFSPAMTALAALVPWALAGMRHTVRSSSPRGPVVGRDRQQPGELTLRAGVGLQRDRVVAGDVAQPAAQLSTSARMPLGLLARREGVDLGELGPGDRLHLGRGVELHRARPERDHPAVEGEVAVGQPPQIAQHRVSLWWSWNTGWVRYARVGPAPRSHCGRPTVHLRHGAGGRRRRPWPQRRSGRPVVVSSTLIDGVGVVQPEVDAGCQRPRRPPARARPGTRTRSVSKIGRSAPRRHRHEGRHAGPRRGRGHRARWRRRPAGPW